jgi:hypothetical protein
VISLWTRVARGHRLCDDSKHGLHHYFEDTVSRRWLRRAVPPCVCGGVWGAGWAFGFPRCRLACLGCGGAVPYIPPFPLWSSVRENGGWCRVLWIEPCVLTGRVAVRFRGRGFSPGCPKCYDRLGRQLGDSRREGTRGEGGLLTPPRGPHASWVPRLVRSGGWPAIPPLARDEGVALIFDRHDHQGGDWARTCLWKGRG